MRLIPAIDLIGGQCVRLTQGRFDAQRQYGTDPLMIAENYADAGAEWLHLVDLDAARGAGNSRETIARLSRIAGLSIQQGGGIRQRADLLVHRELGVDRLVIGSLCVKAPLEFAGWLAKTGPDALVAALDVRPGSRGQWQPAIHGWQQDADVDLFDLLDQLADAGLRHLLCTDIQRDGMMSGPNDELYRSLVSRYPQLLIQASGGVSSLDDLARLKDTGVDAAIVGKALLEGAFDLADALRMVA